MKQEYTLVLIIGLLIAAYVLEAIVQPLGLDLATPYHYLNPQTLATYPFTTTLIIIRAVALFLAPIWLMSFIDGGYNFKTGASFVLAGLTQLYVLQELATGNKILPLEWALAISLAGLAMLLPMIIYFFRGLLRSAHRKLRDNDVDEIEETEED